MRTYADWVRTYCAIERHFGRAANLGYYALDSALRATQDKEALRELLRKTRLRKGGRPVTYDAPMLLSPARSKGIGLQYITNHKSFQIFLALAKSSGIFAMDEMGGIRTLDERGGGGGSMWEAGSIDVCSHVHLLWIDKSQTFPASLAAPHSRRDAAHVSSATTTRSGTPLSVMSSALSAFRPLSRESRAGTAESGDDVRVITPMTPYTATSGKARVVGVLQPALAATRVGSMRGGRFLDDVSEGSVAAMSGSACLRPMSAVAPGRTARQLALFETVEAEAEVRPPTSEGLVRGVCQGLGGAPQSGARSGSGIEVGPTGSRLLKLRTMRDPDKGRLGTAASGLYREISWSEALGSFSGAAGLLGALDSFPAFREPKAARIPPSKRRALLACAQQGGGGDKKAETAHAGGAAGLDSSAAFASRTRRPNSIISNTQDHAFANLLASLVQKYKY
jgi:hypothetical protein